MGYLHSFLKVQYPVVLMYLPVCNGRKYWCWLAGLMCSRDECGQVQELSKMIK